VASFGGATELYVQSSLIQGDLVFLSDVKVDFIE
jgi:hypothetical protein